MWLQMKASNIYLLRNIHDGFIIYFHAMFATNPSPGHTNRLNKCWKLIYKIEIKAFHRQIYAEIRMWFDFGGWGDFTTTLCQPRGKLSAMIIHCWVLFWNNISFIDPELVSFLCKSFTPKASDLYNSNIRSIRETFEWEGGIYSVHSLIIRAFRSPNYWKFKLLDLL